MLPLAVYEYNRPFCIRIHPRTMRNMQLYIETLGVHVEPEMKLPVQVEQTVNEQPNNSPNQAGLVVFLVGIVVLAILGFSVIGEGSGSGMSPVYLLLFLCIVGGPIFIVLSVFSLMLTKVTNTKKEMTNVQNASIQGLSTSDKWALRIFGPVFIVIGIWYSILEMFFKQSNEPLMIQKYLKDVRNGDKRIILLNGEIVGALNRVPQKGESRSNMHVGGKPERTSITKRDKFICNEISQSLKERGLYFVGIDIIGDFITEINVTSPTGIREIKINDSINIEKMFWDFIEDKIVTN